MRENYELRERDGSPQRKDSPPWRGGCEADGVGWIVTLKIKEKMRRIGTRMNAERTDYQR